MANLSLTARCNRDCSYCFARQALGELGTETMPMERYEQSLDFLQRSGISEVRLLGGEPTIHPRFCEMVVRALERGFDLLVFTGGLIPEKALAVLSEIPVNRLKVLVNVLPPGGGPAAAVRKQARVFRRLGERVILGLNIVSPAVELAFLADWIERYGLAKNVRLGLAHPIAGGPAPGNVHLHPRCYPEVGRRVAAFGRRARAAGIRISLDCGWVPCMFPEGALAELALEDGEAGLRCNPILDLLPDGGVISCYPLASRREELGAAVDATWLRSRFTAAQAADRAFTLYPRCARCRWRRAGACTGGCLAASLRRVREADFAFSLPSR
jgi:radical SAM protein with 4Fe4S-binding SPASM domain